MSFAAFVFYCCCRWQGLGRPYPEWSRSSITPCRASPTSRASPVPATIYHWLTPNQYAAMPSASRAFPFLGALSPTSVGPPRLADARLHRVRLAQHVYLGEHYIVDIIGGVIFAWPSSLAKTPSRPGGGRALAERRARRASRPFGRNAPVPPAGLYAHTEGNGILPECAMGRLDRHTGASKSLCNFEREASTPVN